MPCTPLLVSFQNHSILPTNVPSPAFPLQRQQLSKIFKNFKIEVFSKVRQTAFSGSWDNLTGDHIFIP